MERGVAGLLDQIVRGGLAAVLRGCRDDRDQSEEDEPEVPHGFGLIVAPACPTMAGQEAYPTMDTMR